MPYIPKADRHANNGANVGELTYRLQQECMRYLEEIFAPPEQGFKPGMGRDLHYTDLMDVVKALDGAKIDFIDRILLPYEHKKRAENGDVWHHALLHHLGLTETES